MLTCCKCYKVNSQTFKCLYKFQQKYFLSNIFANCLISVECFCKKETEAIWIFDYTSVVCESEESEMVLERNYEWNLYHQHLPLTAPKVSQVGICWHHFLLFFNSHVCVFCRREAVGGSVWLSNLHSCLASKEAAAGIRLRRQGGQVRQQPRGGHRETVRPSQWLLSSSW